VTPERVKAVFCDACRHGGKCWRPCLLVERALYDDRLINCTAWVHHRHDPPGVYHCEICGYKKKAGPLPLYCPNCGRRIAVKIEEEVMA